ncbi:MAG TPA: TolC family protein [Terriglobales bacterium]|jgi:outer membrane protein TolC
MKAAASGLRIITLFCLAASTTALWSEPIPLKRLVEAALSHSTATQSADADQQRAFAAYREARNQYIPQFVVGSGLGASWGYPLSLEGSAPSLVNLNAQSAVLNPSLREFIRAARNDYDASKADNKDRRNQVIQDTVLSYAELSKWESLMDRLHKELSDAAKMEQVVNMRIQEGVDSPQMLNKAKLTSARMRLRSAEAQGAMDVLRNRLFHLTGFPAASIETVPDSIPALPEVKQDQNLSGRALEENPSVQAADIRATAQEYRARGEHKAMWPSLDFAAQYALLSTYNNYEEFFQPGSFQRHNATVGVSIRFPFFSPTQKAHAEAADADALHAKKEAENAKNQLAEETLRLQRSVEQLTAAQQVADLEYQVAQSNLETLQVRADSASGNIHDLEDARTQTNQLYNTLQDTNFELMRARISLLRATGELADWVGIK